MSCAGYEDGNVRSDLRQETGYDRVEFCVVDGSGSAVGGVKCLYDPAASEVRIEGLREGDYRLLVLGVRGDAEADGVTIRTIRREEDEWLSFPADLQRPLGAEYFHSRTPFSVVARKGPSGRNSRPSSRRRSYSTGSSGGPTFRSPSTIPMSRRRCRPGASRFWHRVSVPA